MGTTAPDNDFHRRVLALLEARDMKMVDLARKLGVARGNISGVLRHGHPTLKTVEKFAEVLEVDVSVLLSGSAIEFAAARSELAAARTELAAARLEVAMVREQ